LFRGVDSLGFLAFSFASNKMYFIINSSTGTSHRRQHYHLGFEHWPDLLRNLVSKQQAAVSSQQSAISNQQSAINNQHSVYNQ
jgi:hypothetical protein